MNPGRKNPYWFGRNWLNFQKHITEERIEIAMKSLEDMLGKDSLHGKTFLDIGCGSGLFSLSAKLLGAKSVFSFDFDPLSVEASLATKNKFLPEDVCSKWIIERGSVLDKKYLESLGKYDIVYSWGVLHHTGAMWEAIENAALLVSDSGLLYLGIFNDAGWKSKVISKLVKLLHYAPSHLFWFVTMPIVVMSYIRIIIKDLIHGKPFYTIIYYKKNRGMSFWHDVVDGLSSYPYEFTKPNELVKFLEKRGFVLTKTKTYDSKAYVNEYCFKKIS